MRTYAAPTRYPVQQTFARRQEPANDPEYSQRDICGAKSRSSVGMDRQESSRARNAPGSERSQVEAPTAEQTRTLISRCQETNETLGAFVFLAAVTGCRRGEIAALRWSSIQGDVLIITQSAYAVKGVTGIKSTKTGRERVVHLHESVQEWLQYWHSHCTKQATECGVELTSDSFVLSSLPDGSRFVNLDAVSRDVRKIADHLGMKWIHLHSLRHFAATELLAAGISPHDTAEMLGHADPSLTLRVYAHASTERQRAAAGILAGILKDPK